MVSMKVMEVAMCRLFREDPHSKVVVQRFDMKQKHPRIFVQGGRISKQNQSIEHANWRIDTYGTT